MPYKNKEDRKLASKKSYNKHRDKKLERSKKWAKFYINRNKNYINEYLKTHPCIDCGNDNPIVLDFDHVRGKKLNTISHIKKHAYSLNYVQNEIDKCDIRCANCHRIVTFNRKQYINHSKKTFQRVNTLRKAKILKIVRDVKSNT